ncbi:DUF3306 domain-containing protein [Vibrio sp. CAU 1672]|uniref:DUF3306 domain-containing protein n=1 Tax=Vibrio sp. CAU 1672 TaxID=3032594 RepID=UPI0023DC7500|nr:DUF3306 domain-containing protein [Vibrio sp. CAU 1672]MDF2152210.1 DUF3306 domain-containing protein [Vibrio sp. CAU 1672]
MASNFFERWSARKLKGQDDGKPDSGKNAEVVVAEPSPAEAVTGGEHGVPAQDTQSPSVADNPQVADSEGISVAALLASGAKASVKKAALRKLFLSPEFNELDGLNDYDHDYSQVKSLSAEVAEKLRDWIQEEPEEHEESNDAEPSAEHSSDDDDESVKKAEIAEELDIHPVREESTTNNENVGQNRPHK